MLTYSYKERVIRMLHKLSIKQKLILIMFIPLAVVILLSTKLLTNSYTETSGLTKLDKVVVLSTKIGALVHETQKERGMTAGFIGSKGIKFKRELPIQRKVSSQKKTELHNYLKEFDTSDYTKEFNEKLNLALNKLSNLDQIRNKVASLSITGAKAISYYTSLNTLMLNTVSSITKLSNNANISQELISYMNFLLSKERAGIERAVGTNTFSNNSFATGMKLKFITLVAQQNSYMDSFLKVTNVNSSEFYFNTIRGKAIEEVERMRKVLLIKKTENYEIDSTYWFDQITKKINLLKKVENFLSTNLLNTIKEVKNTANKEMLIFGILSLIGIIVTLILSRSISYAIIRDVSIVNHGLSDFFAFINFKEDNVSLLEVKSSDELGEMAKLINTNIENTKNNIQADKNLIKDTIRVANTINKGHLNAKIELNSNNPSLNELKNIINQMLSNLDSNITNIITTLDSYSNLDFRPTIKSNNMEGTIEKLEQNVNVLRDSITKILIENKKNGIVLNQNSITLSQNMAGIANAANEQAASLEETAASLEEITANISKSTQRTNEMLNYGGKVKNSVNTGNDLATKTVAAMEEINTKTTAIADAITVIDQISFQTNILSLNAAVEAATAGEAGKGFAVVAQEVRNLASRSAEAAKEIKELVESAKEKTSDGKNVASKMIEGYKELNQNITSTLDLIEAVSSDSKEQSNAINQINDAVNKLDKITQQNAQHASHADSITKKIESIASVIITNADDKEFDGKNDIITS